MLNLLYINNPEFKIRELHLDQFVLIVCYKMSINKMQMIKEKRENI